MLCCTFAIFTTLGDGWMGHKKNWEPVKYGKFVSQFLLDIKTIIQQFDRIETKICGQRMSKIFNQIYIYICKQDLALITHQGLICH